MSDTVQLRCETCLAPMLAGDRFCENCGARLGDDDGQLPDGCVVCGSPPNTIDADGYCSVCGARARAAQDRQESDLGLAAAVTDRGRLRSRNEDAFHLQAVPGEGVVAIVCDGISSASAGDAAARDAARAAGAALCDALATGGQDLAQAALDAVGAAHGAVAQVPWTRRADREMPSCTLVGAACRGTETVVASVGDSRAYWVGADGASRLTVDDSWAQERIDEGTMTPEEGHSDPRSHSITHWIGADAPDRPPRLVTRAMDRPGWLVLCTDGLWNYLADESDLAGLIRALPSGAGAAGVARALTETALARGGRDNITVAVIELTGEQT